MYCVCRGRTTTRKVWTLEEGKAAQRAGIMVRDVVLSIEDHIVANIDHLVEYAGKAKDVVNREREEGSGGRHRVHSLFFSAR